MTLVSLPDHPPDLSSSGAQEVICLDRSGFVTALNDRAASTLGPEVRPGTLLRTRIDGGLDEPTVALRGADGSTRLYEVLRHPAGWVLTAAVASLGGGWNDIRRILDHAPVSLYVADRDERLHYVNARWLAHMELPADAGIDEVRRRVAAEPRQVRQRWKADNDRVRDSGQPVLTEEDYVIAGRTHRFLSAKFPISSWISADGEVYRVAGGVAGVTIDITEQRHAEQRLRQSEAELRLLAEHVSDVIGRVDSQGRYVYISPSVRRLSGYDPHELIGSDAYDLVHPEDAAARLNALWDAPVDTPVTVTYRARRRDGEWIWLESVSRRIDGPDGPELIISGRDITARRQAEDALRRSERSLRLLTENIQDTIFTLDLEGRYRYLTPSIERLVGYRPDELLGQHSFDLLHPDDVADTQRKLAEAAQLGQTTGTYRLRHRDGHDVWVEVTARLVDDEIVAVSRDITRRRENAERLRRHAEELHRRNQELQQFAYAASHDLREPLRVITLAAQMLQASPADAEDSGQLVDEIRRAADRTITVLDDMLSLARLESDPGELQAVSLDAALDAAVQNLAGQAADAQIHRPPLLGHVRFNDTQLVQVLQNLIGNALKFRAPGRSTRITVSAERETPGWLTVRVADNGIGVPAEHTERIFGMFERGDRASDLPGAGAGLAICRSIVQRHGGQITLERSGPDGSVFAFTAPVA